MGIEVEEITDSKLVMHMGPLTPIVRGLSEAGVGWTAWNVVITRNPLLRLNKTGFIVVYLPSKGAAYTYTFVGSHISLAIAGSLSAAIGNHILSLATGMGAGDKPLGYFSHCGPLLMEPGGMW